MEPKYYNRKEFLKLSGLGLISIPAIAAAIKYRKNASIPAAGPAVTDNLPDCVLIPEAVEGPYYIPGVLVRSDIRENRPGLDLKIKLKVVDVTTCQPIPNAVVDIWHCDAGGYYSGFTGYDPNGGGGRDERVGRTEEKEIFLRGVQVTDANGEAGFQTIYPGWYTGRTVHIHAKIFLNQKAMVTTQFYFPQELNDQVHREEAPYNKRFPIPHTNQKDFIARGGLEKTIMKMGLDKGVLTGSLTLGIKR